MSSHNAYRHIKNKPSVGKSRKRWNHLKMITFLSICAGLLGLALLPSVAMAAGQTYVFEITLIPQSEPEAGGAQMQFNVNIDQIPWPGDWASVHYKTVDFGDATSNIDYQHTEGDLTWTDADFFLTKTITVDIWDDNLVEGDEVFRVELSNPQTNPGNLAEISFGFDVQTGTITNGDLSTLWKLDLKVNDGPGVNSVNADWGYGNVSCDNDCNDVAMNIPAGADVMVTAIPNPNPPNYWEFLRFDNYITSTNNPETFTLNINNVKVETKFVQGERTITVDKAGSGSGSVTASAGNPSGFGGARPRPFQPYTLIRRMTRSS